MGVADDSLCGIYLRAASEIHEKKREFLKRNFNVHQLLAMSSLK